MAIQRGNCVASYFHSVHGGCPSMEHITKLPDQCPIVCIMYLFHTLAVRILLSVYWKEIRLWNLRIVYTSLVSPKLWQFATVHTAPQIVTQPEHRLILEPDSRGNRLRVQATGSELQFQWCKRQKGIHILNLQRLWNAMAVVHEQYDARTMLSVHV